MKTGIISFLFCSLVSAFCWAADLYVSTSGSDSNLGTQAAPFKTILKASQVAVAGTTVHVAPGTYTGNFQLQKSGTASARIIYKSDTKWGAKIMPPTASSSYFGVIFYNSGSYVTIDGFDIDALNSNTSYRNGIYTDGSNVVIQNNHVHNIGISSPCDGSGGSGINTDHYKGGVNDDVISNHVHDIGPAGCDAFYHGIYLSTSGNAKNNLVYKTTGGGIQTWHDATQIDIVNNTLFNNGYGIIVGSGDFYQRPSAPGDYINVHNNIVFDNNIQGISEQGTTGVHNTYVNNLVYQNGVNWQHHNGTTDSGTIGADPQFANYLRAGGGDYRLKSTSPAIDRGNSSRAPSIDFAGVARPQGAGFDIGAYEYGGSAPTPSPTPTPTPSPSPAPTPTPAPVPVGLPALGVSVASVDFGSVVLGSSSAVKVVVMKNTGTAPLSFTAAFAISSGFSGSGDCSTSIALDPGATCTLNMKFTPTVLGVQSGSLIIRTNAADSPKTVPLSGTGASASTSAPAVGLSPAILNFGSLAVGTSSSVLLVTVTNTGKATLTFNGDFVLSGSDFAWGNQGTCGASLSAGASCTASVIFTPSVSGARSGSLAINDNAAGSPHIVQLSGTGLSSAPVASVSASPTSLSFGRIRVGRSSAVKYVTISNTGKSVVTFGGDSISGDFVFANLGTCASSLAVGASCTYSAKFVPKATGYRSGILSISTNASSTPIKIPLSGKGY